MPAMAPSTFPPYQSRENDADQLPYFQSHGPLPLDALFFNLD